MGGWSVILRGITPPKIHSYLSPSVSACYVAASHTDSIVVYVIMGTYQFFGDSGELRLYQLSSFTFLVGQTGSSLEVLGQSAISP